MAKNDWTIGMIETETQCRKTKTIDIQSPLEVVLNALTTWKHPDILVGPEWLFVKNDDEMYCSKEYSQMV